jgi:methanogenic corrinoid protein MtbC1
VCGHEHGGNTVKTVMNMNGVQIHDLLNEDAEVSAGKLSEYNSDIGSNAIKF